MACELIREKYPERKISKKDNKRIGFLKDEFYWFPFFGQFELFCDYFSDGRIFAPRKKSVIYEETPSGEKNKLATIKVYTDENAKPIIDIRMHNDAFVNIFDSWKKSVLEKIETDRKEDVLNKDIALRTVYDPLE